MVTLSWPAPIRPSVHVEKEARLTRADTHPSWLLAGGLSLVAASSPDPLVEEAPSPGFARLEATHNRVTAVAEMPGRVPSGRRIAAAHFAAAEADAQVNGTGAFADAVLAHLQTGGWFLEGRGG